MKVKSNELRIGNCIDYNGNLCFIEEIDNQGGVVSIPLLQENEWIDWFQFSPIPITLKNIENYIEWDFEYGFNKSENENEFWRQTKFLMENIIDGSGDFEIQYSINKFDESNVVITYLSDGKSIDLGLEDTLHNLQNLFFLTTSKELPIKKLM